MYYLNKCNILLHVIQYYTCFGRAYYLPGVLVVPDGDGVGAGVTPPDPQMPA